MKVVPALVLSNVPESLRIAAHDIGAMAWMSPNDVVDLGGLGTTEVTRAHLARNFDVAVPELVRDAGCQVALVQPSWMADNRPGDWLPLGSLHWKNGGYNADYDVVLLDPSGRRLIEAWMDEIGRSSSRLSWSRLGAE